MSDRLHHIVAGVRARLADVPPLDVVARRAVEARAGRAPRRFRHALRAAGAGGAVIAEIKAASPSAGIIVRDPDPAAIAAEYARGGAAAISVVAEPDFFRGSTAWIGEAARASRLPVLMKHFVVDARQALDGIAAGADAVLLLASVLPTDELTSLITTIESLGCDALVEVHDEAELESALAAGATLVGVNNRNLKTFVVDLSTAERLAQSIPPGVLRVAESGIRSAVDAARMKASGFDAILVGEHLLRQENREAGVRALRGAPAIKICGITTDQDALAAIDAGASFLGLVFAEGSPRRIRPSLAAGIAAAVRCASPRTRLVGVFRDQPLEEMRSIAEDLDLDLVQLHGSEPASIIPSLERPAIRAVPMPSGRERIADASEASWTLFEGKNAGRGEAFDWEMLEHVPRPRRMFLAGGLTPENVRDAVARVRPDGVDVSSGVEERPGKKSLAKMRQFVDEVNQA